MATDVLIGGTGFIGTVLGNALATHGRSVLAIGHQASGTHPSYPELTLDLAAAPLPEHIFAERPTVFLLIGQTGPAFETAAELQLLESVLRQCQNRSEHLFLFSTTLVYGECPVPAIETTPVHPIGAYPAYKAAAEALAAHLVPADQLTILRLGNTYGNPKNRGFINRALRAVFDDSPEPLRLTNQGATLRDYLFIDDLIRAVVAISMHTDRRGTINVSSGTSHSLNELIAAIGAVTGRHLTVTKTAELPDEPRAVRTDNTRLRTMTGIQPTPLLEGLAQTYARYQKELAYAPH